MTNAAPDARENEAQAEAAGRSEITAGPTPRELVLDPLPGAAPQGGDAGIRGGIHSGSCESLGSLLELESVAAPSG